MVDARNENAGRHGARGVDGHVVSAPRGLFAVSVSSCQTLAGQGPMAVEGDWLLW
jgi:hypothetical protein